jgi:hypothetical protein
MNQKYTIIADKNQLDLIGISYNLSGQTGEYVKTYPDGWVVLSVDYIFNKTIVFRYKYDFPPTFLKLKNEN